MDTELIKELLSAGVHFGHQTKRWNPKMKPFIFGSRSGIYIIDLEKTADCLNAACEFVESVAARGQEILFVGTKKQAKPIVTAEATRAGMPFVVNRWLGGTLTNFQTIKQNLDKLRTLRKQKEEGVFDRVSKKDAKRMQTQQDRLEENFAGISHMEKIPGCLFIIDTKREQNAVHEAQRLNIPIVAICDTNANPDQISYPIPGNDDAIRAIKLVLSRIIESVISGRNRHLAQQQQPQESANPESGESVQEQEPVDAKEPS